MVWHYGFLVAATSVVAPEAIQTLQQQERQIRLQLMVLERVRVQQREPTQVWVLEQALVQGPELVPAQVQVLARVLEPEQVELVREPELVVRVLEPAARVLVEPVLEALAPAVQVQQPALALVELVREPELVPAQVQTQAVVVAVVAHASNAFIN